MILRLEWYEIYNDFDYYIYKFTTFVEPLFYAKSDQLSARGKSRTPNKVM